MSTTRQPYVQRHKSWADLKGIPTGVEGEYYNGLHIVEENRATGFEFRREGIELLLKIRDNNYRFNKRSPVDACVFGIDDGKDVKYAVYVEDGFLTYVPDNERDDQEKRQ